MKMMDHDDKTTTIDNCHRRMSILHVWVSGYGKMWRGCLSRRLGVLRGGEGGGCLCTRRWRRHTFEEEDGQAAYTEEDGGMRIGGGIIWRGGHPLLRRHPRRTCHRPRSAGYARRLRMETMAAGKWETFHRVLWIYVSRTISTIRTLLFCKAGKLARNIPTYLPT